MAAAMRRGLSQILKTNLADLPSFHTSSRFSLYKQSQPHIRCCSTAQADVQEEEHGDQKSYLMQAAEERRKKFELLMTNEKEAYERGKRHLANMMGDDPATFNQDDIDRALAYLLPSGIFDKRARPTMKSPEEFYPPIQAAQYGPDGRPEHFLFYTKNPQYYELMHNTFTELEKLITHEKRKIAAGVLEPDADELDLSRSDWITKNELENRIIENISDEQFQRFLALLARICQQPYAKEAGEFVGQYRSAIRAIANREQQPVSHDESGRAYAIAKGVKKSARAEVMLKDQGSGKVMVNTTRFLTHFPELQNRLQILFPFDFLGMVNRFDVEATVTGGGQTSQATAIRHAVSLVLARHFVDPHRAEQMRQAGLLTHDPRVRERKKPGQKKARKKFTWKKR